MTTHSVFLSLILTVLISASATAATTVIVHPDNSADISKKQIQRIFLGKEKKFSNGHESIPINQSPDTSVRSDFDQQVLGRSSSQVSAYWSKLVFTGKGIPPKEVLSDAEVIELVAKNPSAIGYIDSGSLSDAVKAITLN